MKNNPNTIEVREELLKLSGVAPKVADCILLFSDLKRFEVFPIDVWVRRVMNDLYIKNEDETKKAKLMYKVKEYFKTRTLGLLDEDGFFTLTGRASRYYIIST